MHTATIVTTVQLIDAMSPALGMIQNAQALVAQGFLKIRNAADRAFDTSAAAAFQAKLDGIGASLERVAQQADLSAAESSYERLAALAGELESRLNRIGGQSGGSGGGSDGGSGRDSDGGGGGSGGGQDGAAKQWDTLKENAEKVGGMIRKTVELADQTARTNAYIAQMNDGLQTASQLQGMLFTAAQNSGTAYSEVVKTVGALNASAGGTFSSNQEAVVFTELMNKQFVAGGTDQEDQSAVMGKLTDAMGEGVINTDMFSELETRIPQIGTLLSNAFGIGQAELDELIASGGLTAELFKNAMLASSDEINAQFGGTPITWARVWTMAADELLMTLQPVLGAISGLAQHADILIPVIFGVAAAFLLLRGIALAYNTVTAITNILESVKKARLAMTTVAQGAQTTATFAQTAAQYGLNAALLACPLVWIILLIILLVALIYAAVAAVNKFAGTSYSATGLICGAFMWVLSVIGNILIALWNIVVDVFVLIYNLIASVANFIGNVFNDPIGSIARLFFDLADTVLGVLQTLASAIDTVFGSDLSGTVQGWRDSLGGWVDDTFGKGEEIMAKLNAEDLKLDRFENKAAFDLGYRFGEGIDKKVSGLFDFSNIDNIGADTFDGIYNNTGETAANTAASADSLNLNNEELEWMRDLAEQEAINRFTTTEIRVDMGGVTQNVASYLDAETLTHRMVEAINNGAAMGVEGVYA